ncbi:MAG: hypothetical protein R3261_03580 [Alphaproteobacteria bacterium]|nr:hypothetical protein [Alphaproteobacteria bacterium]
MSEQPERNLLPAFQLLKNAVAYTYNERRDFILLAQIPVIFLTFAALLSHSLFPEPPLVVDEAGAVISFNPGFLPLQILQYLLYSMFAVAWIRKTLIAESNITILAALSWNKYKTSFLMRMVQIFGICLAMIFAVMAVLYLFSSMTSLSATPIMFMIALAILTLGYGRLALCLPAAAIGDQLNIKECYDKTGGNSWRLASLFILPAMAGLIILMLLSELLSPLLNMAAEDNRMIAVAIHSFLFYVLDYIGVAITASALSHAYIDLIKTDT